MKETPHPAIFLGISSACLAIAGWAFAISYPITHGQPDFGYALGVGILLLCVCPFCLFGFVAGIAGVINAKRWRLILSASAVLNLLVGCGTLIAFKVAYQVNEPLVETIIEMMAEQQPEQVSSEAAPSDEP